MTGRCSGKTTPAGRVAGCGGGASAAKPLSDELGGGWSAIVPELPGCKSDGDTPADALANVFDAIECWIEAAAEMGRVVPEPRAVRAG